MRIYRPPGSVAFLTCGSVIKPILPKSQCWCVDEEGGKFVLLIRRPQYWRIELSSKGLDPKAESEKFKDILSTILYFEKTVCPFVREFTVELPELPKGPIIKKPWRPVERPKPEVVLSVDSLPAVEVESTDEYYTAPSETNSVFGGNDSDATNDTNTTPRHSNFSQKSIRDENDNSSDSSLERSRTSPPQLTVITSTSGELSLRARSPLGKSSISLSSSTESFHSTQCWHSPLSPFPPSPTESNPPSPLALTSSEDLSLSKRQDPKQNTASSKLTPETPGTWTSPINRDSSPVPQTPSLVYPSDDDTKSISTVSEISTPPRAPRSKSPKKLSASESKIRHRATTSSNSRRRTLSPIPSAASMFSSERRRPRQLQLRNPLNIQVRKIPAAVLRKTCEILLSPPSHLINLMMGIAAKISRGEWKGGWMVWGGEGMVEVDGEVEDDYGFEIRRTPTSSSFKMEESQEERERGRSVDRREIPGSWEVD